MSSDKLSIAQRWKLTYNGWLVHSLARTMFWSDKFRQRFSVLGMSVVSLLILTLMFGANTKRTMIYQMFSLFLAMLLVAILVVLLQRFLKKTSFKLSRSLPKFATVDVPFSYTIHIKNQSDKDAFQLRISERAPLFRPTLHQFLNMHEPDEEKRNIYDRKMGFYRFSWLQHWLWGGVMTSSIVARVLANSEHQQRMQFTPMRRGYVHFPKLRLSMAEPMGLMYNFHDQDLLHSVLVLPKRYDIPQGVSLSAKSTVQQHGLALASDVGEPEEFHHMREYRPGDSPRFIHWPSMAKAEKLLVKEFQDEHFTRQALVLDNFGDESQAFKFEEAVSLAAGFAMGVDSNDMLLDLLFVGGDHMENVVAGRALAHAEQMLEALATVKLFDNAYFKMLHDTLVAQANQFGSCVLILLAWDQERNALAEKIAAAGIPVRIFLIQDHDAKPVEAADLTVNPTYFHPLRMGRIQADLHALGQG